MQKTMGRLICSISMFLISISGYSQSDDIKAMEYYRNGFYLIFTKNYPAAISAFTDALKRDSGFIQAYENRGVAKYYLQDYPGAIADFTKALLINPNDHNTYGRRGMAKFILEDFEGAIADFSMAVEGDLENIRYYVSRGQAKYRLRDFNGAIADFNKVIKSWSGGKYQKGKAFFWRGMVEIDLNQKDIGCLDLSKAAKLGQEKAFEMKEIYCL
jgi:tetratricopeptide (TPR) repeat protein